MASETTTPLSSRGGDAASSRDDSVIEEALLRLRTGETAPSEDRAALAADHLLEPLRFLPSRSLRLSLGLSTLFPGASASVVAAVPLPPTAALVGASAFSEFFSLAEDEGGEEGGKVRGRPAPLLWREIDLRGHPPSSTSPADAALAATLAAAPAPGAETLAEAAAGAERRGGAAGTVPPGFSGSAATASPPAFGEPSPSSSASTTTADAVAEEASSGKWLREWEAGRHSRVPPPPGLSRLAFAPAGGGKKGKKDDEKTSRPRPAFASFRPADFFASSVAFGGSDDDEDEFGEGAKEAPSTSEDDEDERGRGEETAAVDGNGDKDEEADSLLASTAAAAAAAAASAPRVAARRRRRGDGTLSSAGSPEAPVAAASSSSLASSSSGGWARRGDPRQLSAAFDSLRPRLALRFPFELDQFQKEAIALMEAGESVFVAAHTSAGKTAVAEYAIALAAASRGRALYTSPIKTISNQKFREFSSKFDAGLLTGDTSVKPEAQCLILTTEVLRSMLYRGAEGIRDVEWVIFDEVHYVNDAERGVVWEEVIMLLPRRVKLVMLSATVPNVDEFAGWCGKTRGRCFWITGTTKRPVPLEHSLWFPFGSSSVPPSCSSSTKDDDGDGESDGEGEVPASSSSSSKQQPKGQAFVVCSESLVGNWSSKGFAAAKAAWKLSKSGGGDKTKALPGSGRGTSKDAKALRPTGRGGGGGGGGRGGGGRGGGSGGGRGGGQHQQSRAATSLARAHANSAAFSSSSSSSTPSAPVRTDAAQWRAFISWLISRDLVPAASFFFSKKKIDALAQSLRSLDLNSSAEASDVSAFVSRSLKRLPQEDRDLPQVKRVAEGLRRGVGVHHAGLLPLLKEVVEMLFCRGLVKILLCSETFAMGVNAPARAVAFAQLRKHDGAGFRALLPSEYTQMAGRAGRRGIDPVGSVFVPCLGDSSLPDEIELRKMMTSPGAKLESRFRLTPAMILNCARDAGEDLSVEALMRRSFAEFHAARAAPLAAKRATRARKRMRRLLREPWPPSWPNKADVEEYAALTDEADDASAMEGGGVADAPGVLQAMAPGRLVLVRTARCSPATLGVVVGVRGVLPSSSSSSSSSSSNSSSGKEVVVLALVEGEEWPLADADEEEDDESDGGEVGEEEEGDDKKKSAPVPFPPGVPLKKKKDDEGNPFAGMRVLSGKKKSGDLDFFSSDGSSSSTAATALSSLRSLPLRGEAAGGVEGSIGGSGVSFALVAVAPSLVDAVLSSKLPHSLDAEGIASAAASISSSSDASSLSSSPAVGAAALALARARDEFAAAAAAAASASTAAEPFPPYPTPLDPVSDLRVTGLEASAAARRRSDAVARRSALFRLSSSPSELPLPSSALAGALVRVRRTRSAAERARRESFAAGGSALEALPEYGARVEALIALGYLEREERGARRGRGGNDDDESDESGDDYNRAENTESNSRVGGVITLKGRVACELAAAHDGLALSEALFAGALASPALSAADAAALLSCYVFQERNSGDRNSDPFTCEMPTPALSSAFATAVDAAAAVGLAHEEAGLMNGSGGTSLVPLSVEEWVKNALRPGMSHAVHAWSSGAKFSDVCGLTEAMEGTIVRTVMRVDEAARELRDAARVMGDTSLWRRMEEVSEAVRRDIAFAASLYVA